MGVDNDKSQEVLKFEKELRELERLAKKVGNITGSAALAAAASAGLGLAISAMMLFPLASTVGAFSLGAFLAFIRSQKRHLVKELKRIYGKNLINKLQYDDYLGQIGEILAEGKSK